MKVRIRYTDGAQIEVNFPSWTDLAWWIEGIGKRVESLVVLSYE